MKEKTHYIIVNLIPAFFLALLISYSFILGSFFIKDSQNNRVFGSQAPSPYSKFPCFNWCSFDLKTDEWIYSIIYGLYGELEGDINGVTLDNITLNVENKSMEIDITTNQSGVLTVVLQRNLIHSIQGAKEIEFTITVDGRKLEYLYHGLWNEANVGKADEVEYEMFRDEPYNARVLLIPFTKEAKHIQIIGTWVRNVYTDPNYTPYFPCERLQDNCTIQLQDFATNKTIPQSFDIRYAIGGNEAMGDPNALTINDIYIDWAEQALIIETTVNQSGYLTLILPENVIQSWDNQFKPSSEEAELLSHEDFWLRRNFGAQGTLPHFNLIGKEGRLLNISLPKDTWETQISGSWIVGGENIPAELPPGLRPCEGDTCVFDVYVGNKTYPIHYYIYGYRYIPNSENPQVKTMRLDAETKSLIIELDANQKGKGQLVLYLPQNVMRSHLQKFDVYIDGRQGTEYKIGYYGVEGDFKDTFYYQDINSDPPSPAGEQTRVIEVHFDSGTKQVEVRGSWVVSEFDSAEQPTLDQLEECREMGIEADKCSTATIDMHKLHRRQSATNSSIPLIGIGAAIAAVTAFITLRKFS